MLRTLALLRTLSGAHRSLEEVQATIQRACDYRWLRGELSRGVPGPPDVTLNDGTPGHALILPYPASAERMSGGAWPREPAERESCVVTGSHACRAAGAPRHRTLESLSQGLVHGAAAVVTDASRFHYLLEREALRLTWRRPASLDARLGEALAARLPSGGETALLLLELRLPGRESDASHDGAWLDRRLDSYRRLLPPRAS